MKRVLVVFMCVLLVWLICLSCSRVYWECTINKFYHESKAKQLEQTSKGLDEFQNSKTTKEASSKKASSKEASSKEASSNKEEDLWLVMLDLQDEEGEEKFVDKVGAATRLIPKVVYRTAHLDVLPEAIANLYARTEAENPGWKVEYTSFAKARVFIEANFEPRVLKALDTLVPLAYKADLIRLCLVYQYGGVYSDFSQVFLTKLDELVGEHDDLVLSLDAPGTWLILFQPPRLANSFFAASPKHAYIKACIDRIVSNTESRFYGLDCMHPTGPAMMMEVLQEFVRNKPDFDYRLSIGMVSEMIEGFRHGQMFYTLKHPRTKVIQHKLPEHYKALGTKAFLAGPDHYSTLWLNRKIYKENKP
jgi:mannosyltransferase OCH1-like enzyme